MKSYDYIWDTIRKLQREREDEIGSCTLGEALHFICRDFNNGRGVKYKKNETIIPIYFKKENMNDIGDCINRAGRKGTTSEATKWNFERIEKNVRNILESENDKENLIKFKEYIDTKNFLPFLRKYYKETLIPKGAKEMIWENE